MSYKGMVVKCQDDEGIERRGVVIEDRPFNCKVVVQLEHDCSTVTADYDDIEIESE